MTDPYSTVPPEAEAANIAPEPEPSTAADADLWDAARPFTQDFHSWPSLRELDAALTTWAKRKGFVA